MNSHAKPNGRSYSNESKELYWIINTQGSTAYETLHQLFPIPVYNTLQSKVSHEVLKSEQSVLDIKYIKTTLEEYFERHNVKTDIEDYIQATLAIDAICVTPITVKDLKQQLNGKSKLMSNAFMSQIVFRNDVIKKQIGDIELQIKSCSSESKKEKLLEQKSYYLFRCITIL